MISPKINALKEELKVLQQKIKKEEKEHLKLIGSRIKAKRKIRDLTQAQLSEQSGVNRTQITNIEAGRSGSSWASLISLCTVLSTSADYILGLKDNDY